MSRRNKTVLPASLCSCRVIEVPPLGQAESEQIIKYRLSAFYPGSIEDLYIDSVRERDRAVVFYCPKTKIDSRRSEKGNVSFYSSWHILSPLKDKDGIYAVDLGDKIDILEYRDNSVVSVRSRENNSAVRSELKNHGIELINSLVSIPGKFPPLFEGKKRKNYLLSNLLLITLIASLPQLILWRQVQLDEQHVSLLRQEITRLTTESVKVSSSEKEFEKLLSQYDSLSSARPLNVVEFLSDLSLALGRDVTISNLVLKDKSFQLIGEGYNPLGKMESFQDNSRFSDVLLYQVKAMKGSGRESFSLTGKYDYE